MAVGETVTVTYRVLLENIQAMDEFKRRHIEAEKEVERLKDRIEQLSDKQERHRTIMDKGRRAILDFRKEMFLLTFATASVIGVLTGLARSSDSLAGQLEKSGTQLQRIGKNLGDLVASSTAVEFFAKQLKGLADAFEKLNKLNQTKTGGRGQGESAATGILIDSLNARTLQAQGRSGAALGLQLDMQFLQQIQDQLAKGGTGVDRLRAAWVSYRKEAVDALHRTEMGLRTNVEIAKDLQRALLDAFAAGVSEPLFKLFQGEKQTSRDVLKGFQTGANRALADAIGQALKTQLFGGGGNFFENLKNGFTGDNTPAIKATRDNTRVMKDEMERLHAAIVSMKECVCRTAENTGNMAANMGGGPREGMIHFPGASWSQKAGAISNLVGSVALVAGAGASAAGGGASGGYNNPTGNNANITSNVGAPMHTGGMVRAFGTGGEVPITAQAGEFVVRRNVAQMNKDFLTDFNMHGDTKRTKNGGGNVFLIKANDASSFAEMMATPAGRNQIEISVIRAIMGNNNIRRVVRDFTK